MMDCSAIMRTYSRYLLIIFNLFFTLTGIIIISVGISVKAYFHEFTTLLENKYFYISDLLIIIGVIIFLIAFFGCCGAIKENACMTSTFSTLLIIIFLLEVIVGFSGLLLKNKTEAFLVTSLDKTMNEYKMNSTSEITEVWDRIQSELHCCGVQNSTDWTKKTNSTGHQLPISCCKIPPGTTNKFECGIAEAYQKGCLEVFGEAVKSNISYIEAVGIGLAIIQFLGVMFSCYLSKSIRSDYETV